MSQRVAIITGAGRGIGAATAVQLAAAGWSLVLVDAPDPDPALPYELCTAAELDAVAASTGALTHRGDVRDVEALAGAVALAESRLGGLDAAIACAGVIGGGVPQWDVPPATEQALLDINLGGVLNLARVAVPALLRRPSPRSGRFIAVASAAASRGMPMIAAYCAAKAGVTGLVRSLAAELGASGVTANAVSPGSTRTAILDESARLYALDSADDFAAQQPMERLLEPAEIAAAIAFLAGEGSSAITGAVLPVDGGLAL
ncbi:mycofactocin-coupled SDR family oxidoreductase [Jatrophihabitans sp.]|uniref:mycofactocin-coupled SDR family oxidoreductase n=1 Tax=Jatrophihabitans sp. TaxID=1932789 RepID=UPI0030C75B2D|nr:family mycofactocin-dependent oxidoreductase [Jatrophihabitans sp.]